MTIRTWRHCPTCCSSLTLHEEPDLHVTCPACGFVQYENPLPTTVVLPIDADGRLLLVRRGQEPRMGHWDTLGGFLETDESAEQGASRELREEIGVTPERLDYVGSYPSTYGDTGRRTIGIAFACRLDLAADEIKLSSESTAYGWFALDDLPELAFQDGDDAVRDLVHQAQHADPTP
jgi:NAD+ diphosphatase